MAVANTLSQGLTDLAAGKKIDNISAGGRLRIAEATLAVAAADDDGSVYRFVRLYGSTFSVKQIWLYNDAITGGTDFDCGLYDTAENGGAVIDADSYASAVDLSSARTTSPIDLRHEKANINVIYTFPYVNSAKQEVDLCLTANTVGSAAGDITLKVFYTDGS